MNAHIYFSLVIVADCLHKRTEHALGLGEHNVDGAFADCYTLVKTHIKLE